MHNNLNVLLVDDDVLFASLIGVHLQGQNITHELAGSLSKVKTLFDPNKFDAAIIDWNLPDSTGMDIAEFIHSRAANFKLIFLCGNCNEEMAEQAKRHSHFPIVKKNDFRAEIISQYLLSEIAH